MASYLAPPLQTICRLRLELRLSRQPRCTELADIQDRLLSLEEAIADVSEDVDPVAEGQSFTTRILADPAARSDVLPEAPR